MAELIERVYAQSLFDAAIEENALEETMKQVDMLKGIFGETPAFLTLLSSPAVTDGEKQELLQNTLSGRIEGILYNFMRILADKGRASLFQKIADEFTAIYRAYHGILPVTAVTAFPMSEQQIARLGEKLSASIGKKVLLDNKIDPSLIGGVLLRYDGHEIDGSVKDRLDKLRGVLRGIVL